MHARRAGPDPLIIYFIFFILYFFSSLQLIAVPLKFAFKFHDYDIDHIDIFRILAIVLDAYLLVGISRAPCMARISISLIFLDLLSL